MLKQLTLAAFTAIALSAAVSSANAAGGGGCDEWGCGMNGTKLTGVAGQSSDDSDRYQARGGCDDWVCGSNGSSYQGVLLNGVTLEQRKHVVNAVILPSGEFVDLR
jgi:hypothetical protein